MTVEQFRIFESLTREIIKGHLKSIQNNRELHGLYIRSTGSKMFARHCMEVIAEDERMIKEFLGMLNTYKNDPQTTQRP